MWIVCYSKIRNSEALGGGGVRGVGGGGEPFNHLLISVRGAHAKMVIATGRSFLIQLTNL